MPEPQDHTDIDVVASPVNLTANLSATVFDWTGLPYESSVLNESVLGVFSLNE